MAESMKQKLAEMLKGIDRYNPENLETWEEYFDIQVRENAYDLDANLAISRLYEMNPQKYEKDVTCKILLKMQDPDIQHVLDLSNLLEECQFQIAWNDISKMRNMCGNVTGFNDSIRRFVCHVIGITFQTIDKSLLADLLGGRMQIDDDNLKQWVKKYGWKEGSDRVFSIANQDENIKTKNITEKMDFDSVAGLMAGFL